MTAVAAQALADATRSLPDQDLEIDLSRIPTLPRSGVVLGRGDGGAVPAADRPPLVSAPGSGDRI